MATPLIIIGAGLAGWTTARECRKLDARMAETLQVTLKAHTRVTRVDTATRTVNTSQVVRVSDTGSG